MFLNDVALVIFANMDKEGKLVIDSRTNGAILPEGSCVIGIYIPQKVVVLDYEYIFLMEQEIENYLKASIENAFACDNEYAEEYKEEKKKEWKEQYSKLYIECDNEKMELVTLDL